jgi:hypothetical protein
MRKITKIILLIMCVVAASLGTAVCGLFRGYFDHGQFEIKQVQWSSSKQVAIVAERSDQEALDGYTYFVLVGNHLFSPAELRHAYHSDAVIFAAASSCLALHWENVSKLVVECDGSTVKADHIDIQKQQSGGVAISYENIPIR